jgi:hypothetical protein
MTPKATRAMALAAAAALALAGAGCGSDDDSDDPSGGEGGAAQSGGGGGAAKPSQLAIELSGSPKSPTFSVPDSVEGGLVEIKFTNEVRGEHSAQLLRAEAGHTAAEALKAGNAWGEKGEPLPDWAIVAGGAGDVKQGDSTTVTQELEPGNYVVADLNSGANAEFEVTGGSGADEVAEEAAAITATEYAFESQGLEAGTSRVLFDNAGNQPHFIAAVGLQEGKTVADARRFFSTEKGRPPIDDSRGFSTAVIEGGTKQAFQLNLDPGRYVLLCFVPDREGGPPHVAKGMISEATVAE